MMDSTENLMGDFEGIDVTGDDAEEVGEGFSNDEDDGEEEVLLTLSGLRGLLKGVHWKAERWSGRATPREARRAAAE